MAYRLKIDLAYGILKSEYAWSGAEALFEDFGLNVECYSTETAYIYKSVAWYVYRVPQIYLGYRAKPLDDTDLDIKQAYLILC
jgi:hypothetical protein